VSIAEGASVGSLAVLADGVSIGAGSTVDRCVVLRGARIGEGSVLRDCIICPGAIIGDRTQVTDGAMVGEGVTIGADNVVTRGARLFPGMEVPDGGLAF
jgi:mannose-1-phosphate guanylyltransferase